MYTISILVVFADSQYVKRKRAYKSFVTSFVANHNSIGIAGIMAHIFAWIVKLKIPMNFEVASVCFRNYCDLQSHLAVFYAHCVEHVVPFLTLSAPTTLLPAEFAASSDFTSESKAAISNHTF